MHHPQHAVGGDERRQPEQRHHQRRSGCRSASRTRAPRRRRAAIDPVALIATAAMQALRPTFAPIERSRPAVRITSVTPDAMRNVRLACRSTFSRLGAVRKASLSNGERQAEQQHAGEPVAERGDVRGHARRDRPLERDSRARSARIESISSATITSSPMLATCSDDVHRQHVQPVLQHADRSARRAAFPAASRCRARTTCRRRPPPRWRRTPCPIAAIGCPAFIRAVSSSAAKPAIAPPSA